MVLVQERLRGLGRSKGISQPEMCWCRRLCLLPEQSRARLAAVALRCICIGGCSCLLEGASEVGALNVILYVHAEQQVFKDFVVFASIAVAVKGKGGGGGGLSWFSSE